MSKKKGKEKKKVNQGSNHQNIFPQTPQQKKTGKKNKELRETGGIFSGETCGNNQCNGEMARIK